MSCDQLMNSLREFATHSFVGLCLSLLSSFEQEERMNESIKKKKRKKRMFSRDSNKQKKGKEKEKQLIVWKLLGFLDPVVLHQ